MVVDVLLETRSLDTLLSQLTYVAALGRSDARLVTTVKAYAREVAVRRDELLARRKQAKRLVAQRADQKRSMHADLGRRKQMLAGVEREVARLEGAVTTGSGHEKGEGPPSGGPSRNQVAPASPTVRLWATRPSV